jgi:hypothetical protein
MRFMMMIKSNAQAEAGALPDPQLLTAIGRLNEEMMQKGVMLSGEGLQPSSKGARLRQAGGKLTVVDGPFAEAKELIAGFAILEVDSLAEAVEHARRFALLVGSERVDVRRVMEFEDLQPDPRQ